MIEADRNKMCSYELKLQHASSGGRLDSFLQTQGGFSSYINSISVFRDLKRGEDGWKDADCA